jgi:type IV pilus assembly protein PilB
VNEKKGLTFARGLRSILRHDPDKIMVGEIRDPETAQIAIQSALTGHLVFTTVHANNVFDVIGRFLHMQVDPYSFISALNCILAQRLVRVLCPKCKAAVHYRDEQLIESGLDPERYRDGEFFEARGCANCNFTGYQGRTAIAELLELSDAIREMILVRKPLSEVRKRAKEEGIVFLRQVGLDKVLRGVTSLKDLNKVTFVE